jgi:ribosomal protein S27AE
VRTVASPSDSLIASLVENVMRRRLTGPERTRALRHLVEAGLSGREISRRTGLGELTVKKWLRIGRSPELLAALDAEQVPLSAACEMAYLPRPLIAELLPQLLDVPAPERRRRISEAVRQRRGRHAPHGMFKQLKDAQHAQTETVLRTALELLHQVRCISNPAELVLVREVIKLAEHWQTNLKEATAARLTRWSCGMCGTEIPERPRAGRQTCPKCSSTWWTPVHVGVLESRAG